jgi:spermidine synthase
MVGSDALWSGIYLNNNKIDPSILFGSILYLGMGTCFIPRLQSDKVIDTDIIEIDENMIEYNKNITHKWNVIKDDVYEYETIKKYDFIFIDIFYKKVEREIMEYLIEKYIKNLKSDGKIFYLNSVCRDVDKEKYKDVLIFV